MQVKPLKLKIYEQPSCAATKWHLLQLRQIQLHCKFLGNLPSSRVGMLSASVCARECKLGTGCQPEQEHRASCLACFAGMGAQTLDASTKTNGSVRLMDARHTTGWLTFHLDTHGYDFGRPGETLILCDYIQINTHLCALTAPVP